MTPLQQAPQPVDVDRWRSKQQTWRAAVPERTHIHSWAPWPGIWPRNGSVWILQVVPERTLAYMPRCATIVNVLPQIFMGTQKSLCFEIKMNCPAPVKFLANVCCLEQTRLKTWKSHVSLISLKNAVFPWYCIILCEGGFLYVCVHACMCV